MKRKLYIYQENINPEIAEIFSSFGDTITIESIEENMITVLDSDYYNEEPIDIYSFQELIQDDFGREVSIFIEPYVSEGFSLGLDLKEFLKEVPYGVYQFEDIITHVVLKDNKELKLKINGSGEFYGLHFLSEDVSVVINGSGGGLFTVFSESLEK